MLLGFYLLIFLCNICKYGARETTEEHIFSYDKTADKELKIFKLDKKGKCLGKGRRLEVPLRYDAVLRDRKRVETKEFEEASNKRFKIERRFATMIRNHGLRRYRYVRLGQAKIHITLANMVCNIAIPQN